MMTGDTGLTRSLKMKLKCSVMKFCSQHSASSSCMITRSIIDVNDLKSLFL